MRRLIPLALLLTFTISCKKENDGVFSEEEIEDFVPLVVEENETSSQTFYSPRKASDFQKFIPEGYVEYEQIKGDLNKDGREDIVLIIKNTLKDKIIEQENQTLDRNRRGIIILFQQENGYEPVTRNYECFSSDQEDGGIYFPPDLIVSIEKGLLHLHYAYGRYGYWVYKFRYQNGNFELIGYDRSENFGSVTNSFVSVNYSTNKMWVKTNTNPDAEIEGEEIFQEKWVNLPPKPLLKLTEIKDFDELKLNLPL